MRTLTIAIVTIFSLALTAPLAAQDADDGRAGAAAAEVEAAETKAGGAEASAGEGGGQADATPITVLGQSPPEEGAEVPLGDEGGVRVASQDEQTSANSSSSSSSVAEAEIPGLVKLRVLGGDAQAAWTPTASTASSSSELVSVDLGEGSLVFVLGHAEASSDGEGRLYVVRINDTTIGDSDSNEPVTLDVPGVLRVNLLAANAAGGSFRGTVLSVERVGEDGPLAAIASASASGGTGVELPVTDVLGETTEAPGVLLPRTGADIARLALLAMALIALGAGLRAATRTA